MNTIIHRAHGVLLGHRQQNMEDMVQNVKTKVKRLIDDSNYRKQILLTVWRVFGVNFVKAWLFRSGASLFSLLVHLLKTRNPSLFWGIWRVFFARTSIDFGLFAASYFALFKGLEERWVPMIRKRFSIEEGKWDSGIAGGIAAITMLLFEGEESMRRILGHYSAVRAFQIMYSKSRLYKIWGDWLYSVLFMLSSGQIVYCFAKRPEILDPEYRAFLTKVTVFHPTIIQTLRNRLWRRHIDFDGVSKIVLKYREEGMSLALKRHPTMVGCDWIHPESTCIKKVLGIWPLLFKMMFPVYGSLHAIPPLIFRPGTILANPLAFIKTVLLATARSSSFLATFIFIFQFALCAHRNVIGAGILAKKDSFLLYGFFGFLAASSIFIEKGNRRVELSLYVFHFPEKSQ